MRLDRPRWAAGPMAVCYVPGSKRSRADPRSATVRAATLGGPAVPLLVSSHAAVGASSHGVVGRLSRINACLPRVGGVFGSFEPDGLLHARVSHSYAPIALTGRSGGDRAVRPGAIV